MSFSGASSEGGETSVGLLEEKVRLSKTGGNESPSDEQVVRFDEHQLLLLDRLRGEEGFGDTYEDVILQAFRAFVKDRDPSERDAK